MTHFENLAKKYHEEYKSLQMVGAALIRRKSKLDWDACEKISAMIKELRKSEGIKSIKPAYGRNHQQKFRRIVKDEKPEKQVRSLSYFYRND